MARIISYDAVLKPICNDQHHSLYGNCHLFLMLDRTRDTGNGHCVIRRTLVAAAGAAICAGAAARH